MAYNLEFFSDSRIALNHEVAEHPELCSFLANHPAQEFEIRLAEIAAYCEVVLDDWYTPDDLDKLCDILWNKLREKRGSITVHSKLM